MGKLEKKQTTKKVGDKHKTHIQKENMNKNKKQKTKNHFNTREEYWAQLPAATSEEMMWEQEAEERELFGEYERESDILAGGAVLAGVLILISVVGFVLSILFEW